MAYNVVNPNNKPPVEAWFMPLRHPVLVKLGMAYAYAMGFPWFLLGGWDPRVKLPRWTSLNQSI